MDSDTISLILTCVFVVFAVSVLVWNIVCTMRDRKRNAHWIKFYSDKLDSMTRFTREEVYFIKSAAIEEIINRTGGRPKEWLHGFDKRDVEMLEGLIEKVESMEE